MKKTDKMSRAISQLEHIYNTLNTDLFEGSLPVPVITVQSKPGTFGHCSTSKVWRKSDEDTYELNIAAEVLDYPIEETLDTMIHEMIHLYCRENGIKDTSRGGKYHNGRFKNEAEKRGLKCIPCGQYGWNTTANENDRLLEYALSKGWNEIRIGRNDVCGIRVGAFGTAQTGMTVSVRGKMNLPLYGKDFLHRAVMRNLHTTVSSFLHTTVSSFLHAAVRSFLHKSFV